MFSHIMLGASDIEQSKVFYDAVLAELGYQPGMLDPKGRYFYFGEQDVFAISEPINGEPASHGNGATVGFSAQSIEQVDAWHKAGLANGGSNCEEPPGIRESEVGGSLYLAYLRDPTGNKLCAMYRVK